MDMTEQQQPVTVQDFLVPVEDKPDDQSAPPSAQEAAADPNAAAADAAPEDTRSEEERLLDELLGDDAPKPEGDPAIPPPPNSWSKEDAAAWEAMPAEAREVVARREKERDAFVANKGREVAETRRTLEAQALEAVAQHAENFAAQLNAYMAQSLPAAPDPRLLYTGNPDDVVIYQRQDAAHRAALAQHQEMQQRVAQSQQQAQDARRQIEAANAQADAARLRDTLPEFFDPDASPALRQSLQSVGEALGYSPELMAQAGATDILALKQAAEWRDKATKYDRIMAKRMETVRGAKNLPKMTPPGATPGQGLAAEVTADRQAAAISQFQRDRSGAAALDLLAVRKP